MGPTVLMSLAESLKAKASGADIWFEDRGESSRLTAWTEAGQTFLDWWCSGFEDVQYEGGAPVLTAEQIDIIGDIARDYGITLGGSD